MKEVDWELLADHLGGALAGTPEHERVADLIDTDPAWADAAARLDHALAAVATDLRRLPEPTLPDDLANRLDRVLRADAPAGREGSGTTSPPAGEPGRRPAAGRAATRPPAGRPEGRPGRGRAGAGGRGWARSRWAGAVAMVAVVVFGGLIGLSQLDLMTSGDDAGASDGAVDAGGDAGAEVRALRDGPEMTASGAEYRAGTFPRRPAVPPGETPRLTPFGAPLEPDEPLGAPSRAETDAGPERVTGQVPRTVPVALVELWRAPRACLDAVLAAQPAGGKATAVDFAYFLEQPALVIWLTRPDGSHWVWVVGPECGDPGPDERHHAQLD